MGVWNGITECGWKLCKEKLVHGEVTYRGPVYEMYEEDGIRGFVYLLDEILELFKTELISMSMVELLVKGT